MALQIVVALALWHRTVMSSTLGGSFSCSYSCLFCMCVAFWVWDVSFFFFGLGAVSLAAFLRRVVRMIYRVFDLVLVDVVLCCHP